MWVSVIETCEELVLDTPYFPYKMSDPIVHFNGTYNQLIQEVKATGKLCVVDVFASWCGPCRRLAAILPQIAQQNPDVAFFSIDGEQNPSVAQALAVRAFPSIFFLIGDRIVDQVVGADINQIKEKIQAHKSEAKSLTPEKVVLTEKSEDGIYHFIGGYQNLKKEIEARNIACVLCFTGEVSESSQKLSSLLPDLAKEYGEKAAIYEIDVMNCREPRLALNVLAIPDVYIFKGTKLLANLTGVDIQKLKEKINESL